MPLAIGRHIFAAVISQVTKGAESQAHQLFIEGVELAEGWNMDDLVAE
jgi:hypothetical protein